MDNFYIIHKFCTKIMSLSYLPSETSSCYLLFTLSCCYQLSLLEGLFLHERKRKHEAHHIVMIPLILLSVDGRCGEQYILLDHGCRGRVKLEGKNDGFLQCHTVL